MAESDLGSGQATHWVGLVKNDNVMPLVQAGIILSPFVLLSLLTCHGVCMVLFSLLFKALSLRNKDAPRLCADSPRHPGPCPIPPTWHLGGEGKEVKEIHYPCVCLYNIHCSI